MGPRSKKTAAGGSFPGAFAGPGCGGFGSREGLGSYGYIRKILKDEGNGFGERGAMLGGPDTRGIVALIGDGDGDVLHGIYLFFLSSDFRVRFAVESVRPDASGKFRSTFAAARATCAA
jgi:hypothetical protein